MLLLPSKYKRVGIISLVPVLFVFIIRYILGEKPDWLYWPVYAFHSQLIFTKKFEWIEDFVGEELMAVFLIISLSILTLSKEKIENSLTNELRTKSFILTFWANSLLIIFGMFFFFNLSYIYVMTFHLFSYLLIYFITFQTLYFFRVKRKTNLDME